MRKPFYVLVLMACAAFSQNASAQTRIVDLDGKGIPSVKVTARYTCPGMPGAGGGVTYEQSSFTDEEGQVTLAVGPPCPPPPIFYAISKSGFRFNIPAVSGLLPPLIIGTDLPEIVSVSAPAIGGISY